METQQLFYSLLKEKKSEKTKGFKKLTTHAPAGKFEGEPTYKCKCLENY